jgi:hypothetical protein
MRGACSEFGDLSAVPGDFYDHLANSYPESAKTQQIKYKLNNYNVAR